VDSAAEVLEAVSGARQLWEPEAQGEANMRGKASVYSASSVLSPELRRAASLRTLLCLRAAQVPTAQSVRKSSSFQSIGFTAGNRYAQFLMQTCTAIGDAIPGWEVRYDRCRTCFSTGQGIWHAAYRNFVTYGSDEKSLRPQVFHAASFGGNRIRL